MQALKPGHRAVLAQLFVYRPWCLICIFMECTEFRELTGCQQRRWSGTAVCVMRSCPWEGNAQTIS